MNADPVLLGRRITVISNEQPGSRMAGPAIRALNLCQQLRVAGADVVLVVPQEPDVDLGLPLRVFGKPNLASFRAIARDSDVVLTQPQRVDVAAGLHSGGARVIYDLYVPSFVEYPASLMSGEMSQRDRARLIRLNQREYATAVACGDGFLVASQRQQDYLVGAQGQSGRLTEPPTAYSQAFPRTAVVPFGLPAVSPQAASTPVLRGRLVPEDALVALWAGGVWNWFDPRTVIRGVVRARREEPRLRLVFMAAGHPAAGFLGRDAADDALKSPEVRLAVESGAVVFVDDWVPYDQRGGYLLEADVGVCAHFDSPETHMSFRTRLLDHLWAGLPTITTQGGVLGELMVDRGAAIAVPDRDEAAWADALLAISADPVKRSAMGVAATDLAAEFTWPQVSRPLINLAAQILSGEVGRKRRPTVPQVTAYLASLAAKRLR